MDPRNKSEDDSEGHSPGMTCNALLMPQSSEDETAYRQYWTKGLSVAARSNNAAFAPPVRGR
jgi:hypothetical protein